MVSKGRAARAPSPTPTSTPASPRQPGAASALVRSCPLCEAVGRKAPRHRPATCRLLNEAERAKVAPKSDEEVTKLLTPSFIKSLKRRFEGLTSAVDAAKQAEILFFDQESSHDEDDDIFFCQDDEVSLASDSHHYMDASPPLEGCSAVSAHYTYSDRDTADLV